MKRILTLVMVFAVAAMPAFAELPGVSGEGDAEVNLLNLATQLNATTEEKVALFDAFTSYKNTVAPLLGQMAQIEQQLASGGGDASSLAKLQELDKQITAARASTLDKISSMLTPEHQAIAYVFLRNAKIAPVMSGEAAVAAAAPAAAPAASGEDVKKIVMDVAKTWADAIAKGDVDTVMTLFSDEFDHYEYGDKEGLREFLSMAIDMGYTEGLEVFLEDTEVEMDGDTAIVYPIDVSAAFGSATFEYELKKEGDTWKIVGMEIEGI